jgi:hypothetical protein
MARRKNYDVALSFAGENRPYVEQVANALKDKGINVFYDEFERIATWGKDLGDFFNQIYAEQSDYVVIFISEEYVNKPWTNHERKSALSAAMKVRREYVLPARFDDTTLPGLPSTTAYIDLRLHTPTAFASMIATKIGLALDKPDDQFEIQARDLSTGDANLYQTEQSEALYATCFRAITDHYPHWRFDILPVPYSGERIANLTACKDLVYNSIVRGRHGPLFPSVSMTPGSWGNNWYEESARQLRHAEAWRVYQSGLFSYVARLDEQFWLDRCKEREQFDIPGDLEFEAVGHLSIKSTVINLTNRMLFARRLLVAMDHSGSVRLGLRLMNVEGHILVELETGSRFSQLCKTAGNVLGKDWIYDSSQMQENHLRIASEIAVHFFKRFGWHSPPADQFSTWQENHIQQLEQGMA